MVETLDTTVTAPVNDLDDVYLEILLSVFGNTTTQLRNIKSYTIHQSFIDPFDSFSFTLWDPDIKTLRETTYPMLPVRIYVNGCLQLSGRIDKQTVHNDGSITVDGRNYIAEMVDAHCDPAAVAPSGMSLDLAILKVTKSLGIPRARTAGFNEMRASMTGFQFDQVPEKDFRNEKVSGEKISGDDGIFQYANGQAQKHGFSIQPTPTEGEITLARPEYRQPSIYKLTRLAENPVNNNIIDGEVTRDYSRVPTYIEAYGNATSTDGTSRNVTSSINVFTDTKFASIAEVHQIAFGNGSRDPIPISGRYFPADGDVVTNDITLYRPLFFKDYKSKHPVDQKQKMTADLANRTRETLRCRYTVEGHKDLVSGYIWGPDTIVTVNDDIGGVAEDLWIEARSFSYSQGQGQITELICVRPNSYQIGEE